MRIAIVHEWLDTWAGSEQVLAEMFSVFPEASLFAVVDLLSTSDRARLGNRRARTSFIERLPFARRHFRKFLPLMPLAIEQLDLRGFDLVISNSHAVAKGVLTGPDQLHLCYCYTPPRYAWDMQDIYLGRGGWLKRWLLHRFRLWDFAAAQRQDSYLAISHYIAKRIDKCYRRRAEVLYPPLDVEGFTPGSEPRGSHYFTHSRLVPYKRIDLLIEAFRLLPDRELHIAGDGPLFASLARNLPSNVRLLGYLSDAALKDALQTARAFLFAAEEDFGLAPLEAQACGTPVIALRAGGVRETLGEGEASLACVEYFDEPTARAIADAVQRFEARAGDFDAAACRRNAERFSRQRFREDFRFQVTTAWESFRRARELAE